MDDTLKAVEVTGTVDEAGRLALDEPLRHVGPSRVRLIILFPEGADAEEREWLRAAMVNPALDFLKDPAEDVYTVSDGKPFGSEG